MTAGTADVTSIVTVHEDDAPTDALASRNGPLCAGAVRTPRPHVVCNPTPVLKTLGGNASSMLNRTGTGFGFVIVNVNRDVPDGRIVDGENCAATVSGGGELIV